MDTSPTFKFVKNDIERNLTDQVSILPLQALLANGSAEQQLTM